MLHRDFQETQAESRDNPPLERGLTRYRPYLQRLMQPKSAGAPFAPAKAHNPRSNACAFRRIGINDTGDNRSPIAINGTMDLPITAWGAGTVSGAAAASLSVWEMVEARSA